MAYKLEVLSKNDKNLYTKLLKNAVKNKTFFHKIEWLELIEQYYNVFYKVNLLIFLMIDESGDVVALFPVYNIDRRVIRILASPLEGWSTPYLGPVILKENLEIEDVIKVFLGEIFKKNKYDYFEMSLFFQVKKDSFFESFYNFEERKTLLCELHNNEEVMWKMISGRARNMVRKAIKNELYVVIKEDKSWIDCYYNMLIDTYAKSNRLPPLRKDFYHMLFEILNKNDIKVFLAYFNNKPIAGAIFFIDDAIAYYWSGASYREYNSLGANNLIQWEFIKFAIKINVKLYDLVGYGHEGIARFKKSLNPKEYQYSYFYITPTLKGKLGRSIYKIFMPYIRKIQKYYYTILH